MDGRELYSISREFLDKEFGMKLEIPIFINNRMKSTFGYFKYKGKIAWQIDISKELIDTYPREVIIDILKHELVHYALFEQDRPFLDKDKEFKDTVDRLGISRTRTYQSLGKFHRYTCDCGKKYDRKRRLQKGSYCPKCNNLRYIGIVEKSLK